MPSSAAPTSLHFRSAFPTPGQRGSILPVPILNRSFFIAFSFSFLRSSCPVRRSGLTLSAPGRVLLRTWRVISALPHFQGTVSTTLSQGLEKKRPTPPYTAQYFEQAVALSQSCSCLSLPSASGIPIYNGVCGLSSSRIGAPLRLAEKPLFSPHTPRHNPTFYHITTLCFSRALDSF